MTNIHSTRSLRSRSIVVGLLALGLNDCAKPEPTGSASTDGSHTTGGLPQTGSGTGADSNATQDPPQTGSGTTAGSNATGDATGDPPQTASGDTAANVTTGDIPPSLIADTTPDFRASIPKGTTPSDVISYPGTAADKGTWTSGTAPAGTYDFAQFVEYDTRSYTVAGFETYGFTHGASIVPWIGQDCGRPALGKPTIRRWTASFDGDIDIEGIVGMDTEHQGLGGTGTQVTLYVDGVSTFAQTLDGFDGTQFPFVVEDIPVASGTRVDFVISAIDDSSSIANFTVQIYGP